MKDPAIIFKLDSGKLDIPPGLLLTPKLLENINKCRCCQGEYGHSETFVSINHEIYNLCNKCSKIICVKCPCKKTHAFDFLNHICNECN